MLSWENKITVISTYNDKKIFFFFGLFFPVFKQTCCSVRIYRAPTDDVGTQ